MNILGQNGEDSSSADTRARRWGATLFVGLPAVAVAALIAGASLGAAPRLYPPLGQVVPVVAPAERVVAWMRERVVAGRPLGVRLLVLIGLVLLAIVAVSKALDVIESCPLIRCSNLTRRLLSVLAGVVLGLFAARARMETCGSLGGVLDSVLNAAAFGLGAACGVVVTHIRSLD